MGLYQFILTPLEKFYFGKERHPVRPSYFMESTPFPQQSGILGLVRHFLLLSTGFIDYTSKWDDLIGIKSFDGSIGQKFGKIGKIYPMFIYSEQGKILLPVKEMDSLFFTANNGVKVSYDNKTENDLYCVSTVKDSFKLNEQLNLKESFFNDAFVEEDYSKTIQMYSEVEKDPIPSPNFYGIKTNKLSSKGIFIKHIQPGITKSYKAETKEEKAYYKTQFLKLRRGYHFSFLAEIEENLDEINPVFMSFGGENSPFKVVVKKENIPDCSIFDNCGGSGNIFHFLSDTILEKSAFKFVNQFIGETQYFRSMKTDAKNNLSGLHNLNRDLISMHNIFSESKLLIKKGSIAFICPERINEFKREIDKDIFAPYHTIGHNYYKQINKL